SQWKERIAVQRVFICGSPRIDDECPLRGHLETGHFEPMTTSRHEADRGPVLYDPHFLPQEQERLHQRLAVPRHNLASVGPDGTAGGKCRGMMRPARICPSP